LIGSICVRVSLDQCSHTCQSKLSWHSQQLYHLLQLGPTEDVFVQERGWQVHIGLEVMGACGQSMLLRELYLQVQVSISLYQGLDQVLRQVKNSAGTTTLSFY